MAKPIVPDLGAILSTNRHAQGNERLIMDTLSGEADKETRWKDVKSEAN